MKNKKNTLSYHVMMLPSTILLFVFSLIPMSNIIIAFEQYYPAKGIFRSKWIGLANFEYLFTLPDSWQVIGNTLIIAILKIIGNLAVPIIVAIILNEILNKPFKRIIQIVIYLPHFMSWVILGGILSSMLSLSGLLNSLLYSFGIEPIIFLASNEWFRTIIIMSDVWKEFGFGTIIFLAAMTTINPELYESADVDGASRLQSIIHITLPGIMTIIVLMATLSLGNVLNAGFEQIFTMYNPLVYETGDIIDTFVYRAGLVNAQYGLATAAGLVKSLVSFIMIAAAYKIANKTAGYNIL